MYQGVFPTSSRELSPSFLTAALRQAGALPEGRVSGFELASVGDAGQTGEVVRLAMRYEGAPASAPSTLIAKHAATFESARIQMHALGLYEREVRFYQDFGDDPGISTPRCYFAQIDTATGYFSLLLEDVGQGRNGDFWHGSVPDAEAALDHMAAFHAKWWEHPKIRTSPWLMQPENIAYYRDALGPLMPALIPVVQQRFARSFDGYLLAVAQRMVQRWERIVTPRPEHRYTLVHTDFHPKQMFFPHEGRGKFALFDWQGVCVSAAAMDLQRLLITALSPDQVRQHQDRLLARYHRALTDRGVSFPLEQLVNETWEASIWTLYIMIFALGTTDVEILRRDAEANGADVEQRVFRDLAEVMEHNRVLQRIEQL